MPKLTQLLILCAIAGSLASCSAEVQVQSKDAAPMPTVQPASQEWGDSWKPLDDENNIYRIVRIDACDYVEWRHAYYSAAPEIGLIHKADCANPLHVK